MVINSGSRVRSAFGSGIVAMTVAVLIALLWRVATGTLTLPELIGDHLVTYIPGNLFELGIKTLGPLAKKVLLVILIVGQILIGGLLAVYLRRFMQSSTMSSVRTIQFGGIAALGALVSGGVLTLLLAGSGALGDGTGMLAVIAVAYGAVLTVVTAPSAVPVSQGANLDHPIADVRRGLSRRGVLVLAAGVATAAVATALSRGSSVVPTAAPIEPAPTTAPPTDASTPVASAAAPAANSTQASASSSSAIASPTTGSAAAVPATSTGGTSTAAASAAGADLPLPPGVEAEITPLTEFYKVSKNFLSDPQVDASQWHLSIEGLVNKPATYSLADLRAMPSASKQHTLTCISNEVGGNLIGNAEWKGVRLADLLNLAGVKAGVKKVALTGADGYEDSIVLERAMDPGALLAYEMDGAALPAEHGYPLRLLVPNIYGMKNLKWITKIELLDSEFQGYWQRGGWSDPAPIKTSSRIDVANPGTVGQPMSVAGIAFAGAREVGAVQISDDGGKTWQAAQVKLPDVASVWSRWVALWTPKARGTIRLLVRAVDGRGEVQTSTEAAPFPDGSSGWHSVDVKVS